MPSYGTIPAGSVPAGTTPERAPPDEAAFTLRDLLRVIRQRQRLIRRVTVAVVAVTAIVLLLLPILYSATAVVLIDQRKNSVADASAVLSNLPTDTASLQNQIQILTSRDLAGEVVDTLHLDRDPEFNALYSNSPFAALPSLSTLVNPFKWFRPRPLPGTAAERAQVIDAVLRRLTVDTVGLSTSINVRFSAEDAEKAAKIANTFASVYVAQQVKTKSDAARQATAWLTARVAQLSDQVQTAETAVQEYKAKHNLNQGADGTSLVDQQLATINTQLVQARADLAAKRATYSRVKALIASGHVADVSQVVSSPLIVQLRTQEATLLQQQADLATRYGPKHPKLIAVKSQRRDLEAKLKQEVNRIAGSLANDVAVARAQVASLRSSLRRTEHEAARQNIATVKLKALQADAASTRNMYETFVTRLRQTQDQDAIQMSDARVISPAPTPNAPSSPHRTLIFAASIPAGLLLGLLAALLAERFGFAVSGARPVRFAPTMAAPVPVAASMPRPTPMRPQSVPVLARIADADSVRAVDYVIDWPMSGFAQGLNALMRAIATPARGARPRVVAVTASAAEQGKTAIALGLARTAARAGWRVVLVDGDLARAPVARTLGFRAVPSGIVEAVQGTAPLSRCFLRDPRSPLLLLSSFTPLANSYAVLGSGAMARLFAHLRRTADLVVIDATPLAALNETHALLRQADATVLVADSRRSSEAQVLSAAQTLSAMQAPSVGVVFAG
jgi:uncharacterized protein involved in exopolysaccharide biosynthesis/Mrp family chromosome partitioning ATPase